MIGEADTLAGTRRISSRYELSAFVSRNVTRARTSNNTLSLK